MRGHDVVATAGYEQSLEALEVWPEAQLIQEVLVMQARVRPKRGKPVAEGWRGLRSLPFGDCPPLLLLYRMDGDALVLGSLTAYGNDDPHVPERTEAAARASDLVEWLNGGNAAAAAGVAELVALAPERWTSWLERHASAISFHFLELLAEEAHANLTKKPARARQIADAALGLVHKVIVPHRYRHLLVFLHGRLWRERANALRATGNPREALASYEESFRVLEVFPPSLGEAAASRRGAALALHTLDDSTGEPLRIIRDGIRTFHDTFELGEVVISLLYEGHIHFDLKRFAAAESAFRQALDVARLLGDEPSAAHALVNMGQCAQELKRYDDAYAHLTDALALFQKHDMAAECPHVTWGIAWVLADQNAIKESLETFDGTAADFTRLGRRSYAAEARLDALTVLVRAKQWEDAHRYTHGLLVTFAAAGMQPRVLETTKLLAELAFDGSLTEEQIEAAKKELSEDEPPEDEH